MRIQPIRAFLNRLAQFFASYMVTEFSARVSHLFDGHNHEVMQELAAQRRELRSLIRHLSLPPADLWWDGIKTNPATQPLGGICTHSMVCRHEYFEHPGFGYWLKKMGLAPVYHRKSWEHAFICQALAERGMLTPGRRGLGFAVGREPEPALFASMGCEILATDLPAEAEMAADWAQTGEHAASKDNLVYPHLLGREDFDRLVDFRPVNMNAIPPELKDFDFCWSACAFEHLGSIEAGLRFVENSIDCLKPGGFAIHTTEFNLSSDDDTVDHQDTVIFRARDMRELADRLIARGFKVAPFDLNPGSHPLDHHVDLPPHRNNPHLRLALSAYVTTSFGVIIQR